MDSRGSQLLQNELAAREQAGTRRVGHVAGLTTRPRQPQQQL
jgi:hypothetical protein